MKREKSRKTSLSAVIMLLIISLVGGMLPKGYVEASSDPVIDRLLVTNPQEQDKILAENFTSYKEGLVFGSILPVNNIDSKNQSFKMKIIPKDNNTNNTYAFVWIDTANDQQRYDQATATSLVGEANFSSSTEFTLPINDYYKNKYITIFAYLRNNDNKSEIAFSGMPAGVEVDDVIPIYLYTTSNSVPPIFSICGNTENMVNNGVYTICKNNVLHYKDGKVNFKTVLLYPSWLLIKIDGAKGSTYSWIKVGQTKNYVTKNNKSLSLTYLKYDNSLKVGAIMFQVKEEVVPPVVNPKIEVSGNLKGITNLDNDQYVDEYNLVLSAKAESNNTNIKKVKLHLSSEATENTIWKNKVVGTCESSGNNKIEICTVTVPKLALGHTYGFRASAEDIQGNNVGWSEIRYVEAPRLIVSANKKSLKADEKIKLTANINTGSQLTLNKIVMQLIDIEQNNKILSQSECTGGQKSCELELGPITGYSGKKIGYKAIAMFTDGSQLDTKTHEINVEKSDIVAPTVTIEAKVVLEKIGKLLNKALRLEAKANDNERNGLTKIEIYAYKKDQENKLVKVCDNPVNSRCVYSMLNYQDGDLVYYYAKATDRSGNTATTEIKSYYVPIIQ